MKEKVESALILAREGGNTASLAVVANGKHLFFEINEDRLLSLLQSGFEALKSIKNPVDH